MAMNRRNKLNQSDPFKRKGMPSLEELTNAMIETAAPSLPMAVDDKRGTITVGTFTLTSVGLSASKDAYFDDWLTIGNLLRRIHRSYTWLLADWIRLGERHWGDTYVQAAEELGYDPHTLRNYVWVANKVDLSLRSDKLSFAHHRLVARLEDPKWQRYWLDAAVKFGWRTRQMENMMAMYPNGLSDDDVPPVAGLLPGGSLPIMTKKDRRAVNQIIRFARTATADDLKRLDSKQKLEMLEALRELERIAADMKKGLGG
jgi:hypothetical protein